MAPPADSPNTRPLSPLRWAICGLLMLATTLNYMDRIALNQTSKEIIDTFGFNKSTWGEVEGVFSIAFALGTLATGWLVDRIGVYWVYPCLVVGWSLAGFVTGSATGFYTLIGFRFMLGLFEAGNWPCGIRTTRQVLPPEERSFGNSLFQSGTALGAIVTPFIILLCTEYSDVDEPKKWRWPFRVIGLIGLVWVALWFAVVPRGLLRHSHDPSANTGDRPFRDVLADRRFWVLVAVVIGVNTAWHTLRVWMPLYLREQRGFTNKELQNFSISYYVFADIGIWVVGFGTMMLSRWGRPLHQSRLIGFFLCNCLVLSALAIPFVDDNRLLEGILLAFSFGSLGLFSIYFSLSQELSAAHQGKVIGVLGFLNAIYLAGMYKVQGLLIDSLGRHESVLAVAGLPAVIAFAAVLAFWNPRRKPRLDAPG